MHTHQLTLGLAFGLGALHALEPGHGKTAMLAYFASERGSWMHAVVAGISSAVSHSLSLMAIAAMVHLTHHLVAGDHHHNSDTVTRAMQWISAALIVVVGVWMLWSAWRKAPAKCGCSSHQEPCDDSAHSDSASDARAGYSRSALLGIAFGLLPCPSALAAYFTSMSEGSPISAYAVIGLFAAGIATSLSITGIVMQTLGQRLSRRTLKLKELPWHYIRAGLIICVGMLYLLRVSTA